MSEQTPLKPSHPHSRSTRAMMARAIHDLLRPPEPLGWDGSAVPGLASKVRTVSWSSQGGRRGGCRKGAWVDRSVSLIEPETPR